MTTPNIDTKALRQRKQQPIERIRDAFARAHKIATGGRAHYMSIPADAERDADLILSDAIDELEALRNAAPALLDLAERAQGLERDVARADAIALTASKDANELEAERDALKAEVAELRAGFRQSQSQLGEQTRENIRLGESVGKLFAERDRFEAKLSASEREAERLREALTTIDEAFAEGGFFDDGFARSTIRAALRGEEAPRE